MKYYHYTTKMLIKINGRMKYKMENRFYKVKKKLSDFDLIDVTGRKGSRYIGFANKPF